MRRPKKSTIDVVVMRLPFQTVMPMFAMKASTSTTTRKSSGRGISRNLRPSHQLK